MSCRGLFVVGLALVVLGCSDPATSQLSREASPAAAAAGAIAAYDKDGDGKISPEELKAAPALAAGAIRIDANNDGWLTSDEIQSRYEAYDLGPDLIGVSLSVFDTRGPLAEAKVTLTPEPYQGEAMQSYSGITEESGACTLTGSEAQLPGLPTGLYLAHVIHEPSGADQTLGCEVASDASGNRIELRLAKATPRQ